MENFNVSRKEMTAMELKYLGNSYQEISEKLDIPYDTIGGWFTEKGKLFEIYSRFTKDLEEKRKEKLLNSFVESDEQILIATTNMMRKVGKDIGEGKLELNVSDYKRAWEIQRVMSGRPTDVKSQNMTFDQAELDKEAERLKRIIDGVEEDSKKQDEEDNNE